VYTTMKNFPTRPFIMPDLKGTPSDAMQKIF
jgi:hypothetical protein